ncbi:hypothetical protein [Flavobacterium sp. LC2016-01]|uniref:hypothetical protein n=1 Tax=Flavobacterium sp. LC2016-01 TaxID=2675876 RepID=UPI0012BB0A50|nr:hypothetical protein [Flavobacterium sp. LC2016-01]MTH14123.1 hypothetical protein [Flavobacterium sp. LC2016-01]
MKYSISEENKQKFIKKSRIFMSVYYGSGMLIAAYVLTKDFNSGSMQIMIFYVSILIVLPIAWFYFDKKWKKTLSTVYEIDNEKIIITEKGKPTKTISLNSIFAVTKIPNGYRVESKNGKFYIFRLIEKQDELVDELKKHIR